MDLKIILGLAMQTYIQDLQHKRENKMDGQLIL
jgi:hypothetical protein